MKGKDIQRYMKLSEAMKYLNLKSYQSLHKFIDDGLRVVSVGDTKRIDRVDADKFMEAHKTINSRFCLLQTVWILSSAISS